MAFRSKLIAKQAEFQIRFIWWALGLAIFAGLAIGAHVAFVLGFSYSLSKGFYSFIQIHGHLQLVGWAGLFIIGISLHFIPRLAGAAITKPQRFNQILGLIVTGLILRFIGHSFLPYLTESKLSIPLNFIVMLSGLIEILGILLYLTTILQTLDRAKILNKRPALQNVKPFFLMMIAGWFIYPVFNVLLLLHMLISKSAVLNQAWNEFAIQLFIGLVLLPVAFAFSARMFPLYLRLPAVDWSVQILAVAYLVSLCVQILPTLPPILRLDSQFPVYISNIGKIIKGGIIIWFIWKLDILSRRREPWTVHRKLHPSPDRRPTRKALPDYGEFGRFERLVYTAYIWLFFGALLEMHIGISTFTNWTLAISSDAVRHSYLLGFVTHLMLGMSVRMIPGFIKKKKVFSIKLVSATFWLGLLAVSSRVLPLIMPLNILQKIPGSIFLMQSAFACSGILALSAVICLAVNLTKTANLKT